MRIAVYTGTFDPITNGHLSVIERAARLFDQLRVLVAVNPTKSPMFSLGERIEMIGEATCHLSNVSCDATEGLVASYAQGLGAVALIRGIRGETDAESEIELAHINRLLAPEMTTLFVPADPHLSEVSSSQLKHLAAQGVDVRQFAPASALRRLVAHLLPPSTRETVHGPL
jgi:pantetheine-phosphate adenylyltransferase